MCVTFRFASIKPVGKVNVYPGQRVEGFLSLVGRLTYTYIHTHIYLYKYVPQEKKYIRK